ncbi:MAG: response regulator [Methylovulum sp.]|jgi:putative two-component system response regulator|nr:response regulator [Methylovulum sp.]
MQNNNKSTLLIVDDTPENLTHLGNLLAPYYRVKVANSGARALSIAHQSEHKPDLILLDILMPDMDGYAVLEQLKEHSDTHDIPVMFVTSLEDSHDEAFGLSLGAADYVTKPIKPAILLSRIQNQLELTRARKLLNHQNAWLEKELGQRLLQIEQIRELTLVALESIADVRDKQTGHHSLRTQAYVKLLCEQLVKNGVYVDELTTERIDNITKAAPLYALEKPNISHEVIFKQGQFSAEDINILKTYPILGAQALWQAVQPDADYSQYNFLNIAVDIAKHRQEKWDGSGFPQGLEGKQIPLHARIMALADIVDSFVKQDKYPSELSLEDLLALIKANRGVHFDPAIVDAFFASVDKIITASKSVL